MGLLLLLLLWPASWTVGSWVRCPDCCVPEPNPISWRDPRRRKRSGNKTALSPVIDGKAMSSLVKEDLNKKLFKTLGQSLHEFIEVECTGQDRFYLCASVTKGEEVQISMVKHFRIGLDENYEISEKWFLDDLEMIDGKEADADNPWFDMHFKKVYSWEAYSCASKYAFARTLNKLNEMYLQKDLKIVNFDFTYINEEALWSSSNGDCVVLMRICFYASNLLCLSLCPLPG